MTVVVVGVVAGVLAFGLLDCPRNLVHTVIGKYVNVYSSNAMETPDGRVLCKIGVRV